MTAGKAPHPFSIANYRIYWVVRLASMLALYSMMLIVGWQAYNLARETMGIEASATRLGLIGLLQFLPLFFLTPVTGWVADNIDRRWVIRSVLAILTLLAAALALLTRGGVLSLWMLYAFAVMLGAARAFLGPAHGALAANLVPKESIPTAIALSSIAWQAGMLIGPAIAGPLYRVFDYLPYAVSAALFGVATLGMFLVGPVPRSPPAEAGPLAQIREGMHYVLRNKLVLGVITLDLFAVLLAGATALIPVFARDILTGADPETMLSMLAAAPAAGAAVIAVTFSFFPLRHNVGNRMMGSVIIFGIATIFFAFSTVIWLSIACLFICGAADMFSVYVRSSLIQLNTPDSKRGRVSAVAQLTVSASNELGEAESGMLAGLIGPVWAVVAGGVGAIMVTILWARLFPQIGAAKSFDQPTDLDRRPAPANLEPINRSGEPQP
ncbi:MAG: MFS transporter [Blastomonas sp.]